MATDLKELIKSLKDTSKDIPDLSAVTFPKGKVTPKTTLTVDEMDEFEKGMAQGWAFEDTEIMKEIWAQAKFVGFNLQEKINAMGEMRKAMGADNYKTMINFLCQLIISGHLKFKRTEKQISKRGNREMYELFNNILMRYNLTLNHVALICAATTFTLFGTVAAWGPEIIPKFKSGRVFTISGCWQFARSLGEKRMALAAAFLATGFKEGYKVLKPWNIMRQMGYWNIQKTSRPIDQKAILTMRGKFSIPEVKDEWEGFESELIWAALKALITEKTETTTPAFFRSLVETAACYLLADTEKKIIHNYIVNKLSGGGQGFADIGFTPVTKTNEDMKLTISERQKEIPKNQMFQFAFWGDVLAPDIKTLLWPDWEKADMKDILKWASAPDFMNFSTGKTDKTEDF